MSVDAIRDFSTAASCRVALLKYHGRSSDSVTVETSLILTAASFAQNNLLRSLAVSMLAEGNPPMNPKMTQLFFGVVLIFVLTADLLHAQDPQATLSGTITNASGQVVANAKVTIRNSSTGQSAETQTDLAGLYTVPNLAAGEYEISAYSGRRRRRRRESYSNRRKPANTSSNSKRWSGAADAVRDPAECPVSQQDRALARRLGLFQDRDAKQRRPTGLAR